MDVVKDETGEAAGPGMGASAGRWEDEIGTILLGAGVRPAEACAALARSLGTSGERAGVLVIFRDPETLRFGAASWPEGAAAPDSRTLRRFVTSIGARATGDPLTESWARTLAMESGRTAVFPVRYGDVTVGALVISGDVAPRETLPGYERTAANLGWELVGARDPASAERPEGRRRTGSWLLVRDRQVTFAIGRHAQPILALRAGRRGLKLELKALAPGDSTASGSCLDLHMALVCPVGLGESGG